MEHRESREPDLARIDRRLFLGGLTLGAAAQASARAPGDERKAKQPGKPRRFVGMITRQKKPDNLEFPFASLESFLTPTEQFFVRNHFEVPRLEAKSWRLVIEGEVERPLELTYDELRQMTPRTVPATLECSGNSRVFLDPPQVGVRWEQGAVGNAEWTGVSLAEVLRRAEVKKGAVEVIAEGADSGKYESPLAKTPGKITFARSLPLKKAQQPEVLLAYQMNGKELTASHGFPVRLVVPGWYGMASVKWLTRLLVSGRPFNGYFQTFQYALWKRRGGLPDLEPVTEMEVKAQIARPASGEVIAMGEAYRVFGAAWTGEADVTRVEVSADGGKKWTEARLLESPMRHAWRLWEWQWTVPTEPGQYTLMARATDSQMLVQPLERDPDRRDAMISHVQRIEVEVR